VFRVDEKPSDDQRGMYSLVALIAVAAFAGALGLGAFAWMGHGMRSDASFDPDAYEMWSKVLLVIAILASIVAWWMPAAVYARWEAARHEEELRRGRSP
jgi:hypothetical protein